MYINKKQISNKTVSDFFCFFQFISSEFHSFRKKHVTYPLDFDKTNRSYDESNGVFYQIWVVYFPNPVNNDYQSLGIYVPKKYLKFTQSNG